MKLAVLFLSLAIGSLANADSIELSINLSATSSKPDARIKRGYVLQGAVAKTSDDYLDAIRKSKQLGNELVGIFRDINQFQHNALFESYRSRGGTHFGANGEAEEFSLVDGAIQTRLNSQFLEMCRLARGGGMQIIFQLAGTPVEGLDDGSVRQLFTLDPNREYHGSARYYPIPVESEFDLYAETVADWARKLVEATGASDAIWVGTQEPEHTLGFPGGVKTQEFRFTNLADYTRLWKRLSDKLQAEGWLTGGMQNNAGAQSGEKFLASIDALHANECSIDFLTIQNYSGGDNERIIREALEALNSKIGYENAKILFHRYQPSDLPSNTQFGTAEGVARILQAEEVLFDHANAIYGYCIHTAAKGHEMTEHLLAFLNSLPRMRKDVESDNENLGAFAFADEEQVSVAIWNVGTESSDISLELSGGSIAYPTIHVAHGSGKSQSPYAGYHWDAEIGLLDQITLSPNEYLFINLRKEEASHQSSTPSPLSVRDLSYIGALNIEWRTVPGLLYELQSSEDLHGFHWTSFQTPFFAWNDETSTLISAPVNSRFFRIKAFQ